MVKHVVMWRLKEQAHGNGKAVNALLIKKKLEALDGRIPGLVRIEAGIDFAGSVASFDVVLYSEFIDSDALIVYQTHPEHEAVKSFIVEVTEERVVVDYEDR